MDIKKIIKEKGYTLERVASSMEPPITKGTLSRNISNNPTVGTLQKIADIIGCKVGDFFQDEADTFSCPNCGRKFRVVPVEDERDEEQE